MTKRAVGIVVTAMAAALAGCSSLAPAQEGDKVKPRTGEIEPGGISIDLPFSGDSGKGGQAGIGVNSFLWRASLDTLSFMPLASADPFGGVITTDWYANPEKPNERFKATVYILDTRLRADGLNVSIFKQQLTANGWMDTKVDPETEIQIENAILVRARQLRLATLKG